MAGRALRRHIRTRDLWNQIDVNYGGHAFSRRSFNADFTPANGLPNPPRTPNVKREVTVRAVMRKRKGGEP